MLGKSGKFCQRGGLKWVLKVWMDISMLNAWKAAFKIEGLKKASYKKTGSHWVYMSNSLAGVIGA